jgi:ATP-dependent Lhr-like helicase
MTALPPQITRWFDARGWSIHPHQRAMLGTADRPCQLLIAPTGGGKTMAGFLPTLADLADGTHEGLHTLYVSPLKALAADIRRNLTGPIDEMGLPIRVEDRTGDTSATRKKRQRADPPHILLTTPESLALLTSYEDAGRTFAGLKRVIVDEIHALASSASGSRPRWTIPRPSRASSRDIPTPARSSRPIRAPIPTSRCSRHPSRPRGPAAAEDTPFPACWRK